MGHSLLPVIFRVYCADHTYCTLRFPLNTPADSLKHVAADKLGLKHDDLVLVELKSSGKRSFYFIITHSPETDPRSSKQSCVLHPNHYSSLVLIKLVYIGKPECVLYFYFAQVWKHPCLGESYTKQERRLYKYIRTNRANSLSLKLYRYCSY